MPDDVHLFGIRHHGPGSARTLAGALDELGPAVLLVELPADVAPALPLVADDELVPPVALLGYVVDHPERAAFLPLARFSPEWVALRWAAAHRRPVVPIDLELAFGLAPGAPERGHGVDAVALLASAAGESDPERWWEDMVEHRAGPDPEDAFRAVAEAMVAVRGTAPPPSGHEARREAAMREAIRRARAEGVGPVAVVCGAWHVPALTDLDQPGAARADQQLHRSSNKAKVAVTWVPWTHRRLASASGYGAGVASPGWYDHVFAHRAGELLPRWFTRAAQLLRGADHPVSPEHVIAAVRLADGLAGLRCRPHPGLDEALDAAHAVLTEGRPGPLALVNDHLVVGDELGRVSPRTPMVPLARDLQDQQRRLRLRPEATARTLELDLRVPLGRGRSHLLHRLSALGVPWGRPADSRGSSGTFRETWSLRWEPELAIALVEASPFGTTVARAAAARLIERGRQADTLGELTALVEMALLAELPDAVGPLMAALADRAARESDVARLLDALGPLARARRYGDVRSTDTGALAEVVDGLVVRAVVGLRGACRGLDDDEAAAMAERLQSAQSALVLIDHPARADDWPQALGELVDGDGIPGAVAGRAARLLHDAGWWSPTRIGAELARTLSVGTPPARAAAFVEGFVAGSGTVLLHDEGLLRLLDAWVAGLAGNAFGDVVPLLRRTFGGFEAAERRQLGQLVGGRGDGRPPTPFGWDLDEARVGAALRTVATMLGRTPGADR